MNKTYKNRYDKMIEIKDRKLITAHIIYILRVIHGLTQKQVADLLEIQNKTYRTYEVGRNETPQEIIVRLALLYEVPTDYLLQNTVMNNEKIKDDKIYTILPSDNDYKTLKYSKLQLEQLGIKKTNKTYKCICETIEVMRDEIQRSNK